MQNVKKIFLKIQGMDNLRERAEKYFNLEKGPHRNFDVQTIDGNVLYTSPNGIAVCEIESSAENDKRMSRLGEIIERDGPYVIRLRNTRNEN